MLPGALPTGLAGLEGWGALPSPCVARPPVGIGPASLYGFHESRSWSACRLLVPTIRADSARPRCAGTSLSEARGGPLRPSTPRACVRSPRRPSGLWWPSVAARHAGRRHTGEGYLPTISPQGSGWDRGRSTLGGVPPRQKVGPLLDLVRESYVCSDCGTAFDPGKGTATKRCTDCRTRHDRERPDRKANRAPVDCEVCAVRFQPAAKGHLPTRCPACRDRLRREAAALHNREVRAARAADDSKARDRVRLSSREAACQLCGTPIPGIGTRGPLPTVCRQCRRQRNREAAATKRAADEAAGLRPWLQVHLCADCGTEIPVAPRGRRRRDRCDDCWPSHRKPYQKDTAKNRAKHLRRSFGMTVAEYAAMSQAQGERCAICETKPDTALHIDHDHETMVIRGLLCGSCNRMIGLAKDDPARLAAAITYLTRGDPPPL